jgi:hypothetical protein
MSLVLRLLVIKIDIAEKVALRNLVSLELIDGIETYRNLSHHRMPKVTVDGVDV